jgi:hypothetical protein
MSRCPWLFEIMTVLKRPRHDLDRELAADLGVNEADVDVLLELLDVGIREPPDELASFLRDVRDPHGGRVAMPGRRRKRLHMLPVSGARWRRCRRVSVGRRRNKLDVAQGIRPLRATGCS